MDAAKLRAKLEAVSGKTISPSGRRLNMVLETEEFRRIRDMPRRSLAEMDLEELSDILTEELKTARGEQRLRPFQAATLREVLLFGGALVMIRVGGGKTLPSFLAGTLCEEERVLLLVPAQLLRKTQDELQKAARHWRIRPLRIESYEALSRDRTGTILHGYRPTMVIADEAQKLKNTSAGCTKRLSNYLREVRRKGEYHCRFVAMSGSITTRSLREYWHLAQWALGAGAPLPAPVKEFMQWCWALDEKVTPEARWQPGALERLAPNPPGKDVLERARNAYQVRLVATRGVISTAEEIPEMGLSLRARVLPASDQQRAMIANMRATGETPDGHPFETPMELWRHAREMQCDFYYVWDPRPPAEWLAARRELSRFIRERMKAKHAKVSTPGDVYRILLQPELFDKLPDWWEEGRQIYDEWREVKNTFRANTVPVWIGDACLRAAADWLETDPKGKICWVEHRCFGQRLAEMTGRPYFAAGAVDARGRDLNEEVEGPLIASVKACGTGRNLQFLNWRNLYVSPMSKNNDWEQTLGRTHRDLQPRDVEAEVFMMCRESYSSMMWACREAEYTQQTTGQPQKLVYCDRDLGAVEALVGQRSNDDIWKQAIEQEGI